MNRYLCPLGWARLIVLTCASAFAVMPGPAGGAESITLSAPKQPARPDDTFVRMFPGLPPFAPATDEMREKARKLGEKGGILDPNDQLENALESILNPGPNNPDNPAMTAGMTFLGQFIDHDLTLDPRSSLFVQTDPFQTKNFRTAAFDLDSVYGRGPQGSPELYDVSSGDIKLKVEVIPGSEAVSRKGAVRYDVPRDINNTAIIGDGRNDENAIISQLHLAVLRFHNAVVDYLRTKRGIADLSADQIFMMAQRYVRWHYQWIVVHEFLPLTIGQQRVDDILRRGPKFYNPHDPSMQNAQKHPLIPVEFSVRSDRSARG